MSDTKKAIAELFTNRFGDRVKVGPTVGGIVSIEVQVDSWLEVCRVLRDEGEFGF